MAVSILIMQPLPAVATEWLQQQGAELFFAYESDEWRKVANRIRALVYYSVPIDKPLMDELPALEVIGKRGAGIDTIDLAEAARRGVRVTNVGAGGNANTVTEHALTLLLAATRSVVVRDAAVREGRFTERFDMPLVNEIAQTRLGIVGVGNLGKRISKVMHAGLECEIGFFDPFVTDPDVVAPGATRFESLGSLFDWAQNVVIAAPLTDDNRGSVGYELLELLGPEGVLVIVSRGGIVDEGALAAALKDGAIRAAGVDVYDDEPPEDSHPLFALDNVVLTPHVAGGSVTSRARTSLMVCQQVWAHLHGEDAPLADASPWLSDATGSTAGARSNFEASGEVYP